MTPATRALVLVAVLWAGCSRDRPEAPPPGATRDSIDPATAPAGDSAQQPSAPPAESDSAIIARWRARVPAELLVRTGACPFECCVYREWRTDTALVVVARERAAGPALFTIPPGASFRADSGNVHITGIQLIVVADSVGDPPYWSFAPGDTLIVLDPIGEGHFNVWDGREVKDVEGFWGAERIPPVAEMFGRWETEWWVHVTLADDRSGWTRVPTGVSPPGADACAQ